MGQMGAKSGPPLPGGTGSLAHLHLSDFLFYFFPFYWGHVPAFYFPLRLRRWAGEYERNQTEWPKRAYSVGVWGELEGRLTVLGRRRI